MITFQTISILFGCIVVLMGPATRTELRNTRESPLRSMAPRWRPAPRGQVWVVGAQTPRTIVLPYDPPVTGHQPQYRPAPTRFSWDRARGPAKRRVAAGQGHSQLGHGPLAWIWAELDPHTYPVRAAADGRILAGAA